MSHTIKINKGNTMMYPVLCTPVLQLARDVHFCQPSRITNEKNPSLTCPYDGENMVIDEKYGSPHVGIMYICPKCGYHDNVVVIDEDKLVEKLRAQERLGGPWIKTSMPLNVYHEKMKDQAGGIITFWEMEWIFRVGKWSE